MTLTLWCSELRERAWTLRLLIATCLLAILKKWNSRCVSADPLELAGLMMVIACFVGTLRLTLCSILCCGLQLKRMLLKWTAVGCGAYVTVLGVLWMLLGLLSSVNTCLTPVSVRPILWQITLRQPSGVVSRSRKVPISMRLLTAVALVMMLLVVC